MAFSFRSGSVSIIDSPKRRSPTPMRGGTAGSNGWIRDRAALRAGITAKNLEERSMRHKTLGCIAVATILFGCNDDGGPVNTPAAGTPRLLEIVSIQGVGATTNYSFDLGLVVGNRYFVTDRNNAAVDIFSTGPTTVLLGQVKGTGANAFAGVGKDNSVSGPDGINGVGNLLYVGDVDSVKVVDPAAQTVTKTIIVGTSGKRADEGCVDATHNLYMISTPEAPTPFATFINTSTQAVVAQVTFTDSAGAPSGGLEQCRYDSLTDMFYVNNDATSANPHGELVAMPGSSIRAIASGATINYTALAGVKMYSEGNCDPTGLALGPLNDIAVNCREVTAGAPLLVQIMDKTTGVILKSINAGGGDQLEYDGSTNRYYNAASRWTASGTSSGSGCSTASPCTPVLAIIDAATRTLVVQFKTGNNAHSVAIDPAQKKAYVPVSSDAAPAGCQGCNVGTAGLLVIGL